MKPSASPPPAPQTSYPTLVGLIGISVGKPMPREAIQWRRRPHRKVWTLFEMKSCESMCEPNREPRDVQPIAFEGLGAINKLNSVSVDVRGRQAGRQAGRQEARR